MSITQIIYSVTIENSSTVDEINMNSLASLKLCEKMGITGRSFHINYEGICVKEGKLDMLKRYFGAVKKDPWADSTTMHFQRELDKAEFDDYEIWVKSSSGFNFQPHINALNRETMPVALPHTLPAKFRIMVQSYLPEDLF